MRYLVGFFFFSHTLLSKQGPIAYSKNLNMLLAILNDTKSCHSQTSDVSFF